MIALCAPQHHVLTTSTDAICNCVCLSCWHQQELVALLERQRSSLLATEDLESVIVSVAVYSDSTDSNAKAAATVTASGMQCDAVLAALSNSSSSGSSSVAVTGKFSLHINKLQYMMVQTHFTAATTAVLPTRRYVHLSRAGFSAMIDIVNALAIAIGACCRWRTGCVSTTTTTDTSRLLYTQWR